MGHIHAAAMAEYAKDAAETDMPWERWEFSLNNERGYKPLRNHPSWDADRKYRRKAKTILINGHEVPEPSRTPLEIDDMYWTIAIIKGGVTNFYWSDDSEERNALKSGFIHLTKEAAEKHFNALKSFTAQKE